MSGDVFAGIQTTWNSLPPVVQDLIAFHVVHHAPRIMHHTRRMSNDA
jgi:hypothetical protein